LIQTHSRRRLRARFSGAVLVGTLALGVLGSSGASAAVTYSKTAAMVLQNVPNEDMLANTHGICDGAFTHVIRNVGGSAGALRALDAAQACGLKMIVFFSETANHSTGVVYPSRVGALVRSVKDHPALYGYLSVKEPSWVRITGAEIRSLYKAYKAADPTRPVAGIWGDIPHFGDTRNPYTAGMADIVIVDWYPVETASGGCSRTGTSYVKYGPKWFSTKVRPVVAAKTPGRPIWVMVQTHKYLAPTCHKKQRPSSSLLDRQVREAFGYARAKGIAFHTFRNDNYNLDQRRDPAMVKLMKGISARVAAGTFQ